MIPLRRTNKNVFYQIKSESPDTRTFYTPTTTRSSGFPKKQRGFSGTMISLLLVAHAEPSQFMPAFNNSIFNQKLSQTETSVGAIVNAAAKAGKNGGKIAATSMKSIKDHPCEKSPAPGCVSP